MQLDRNKGMKHLKSETLLLVTPLQHSRTVSSFLQIHSIYRQKSADDELLINEGTTYWLVTVESKETEAQVEEMKILHSYLDLHY